MKKITIKKNNTLKEALLKLNYSGEKCLIVTDYKKEMGFGTFTEVSA